MLPDEGRHETTMMKTAKKTMSVEAAEALRNDMLSKLNHFPASGRFTWKYTKNVLPKVRGKIAGCQQKAGYRVIKLSKVTYYEHQLAWLSSHGVWPSAPVLHKDDNLANNGVENLVLWEPKAPEPAPEYVLVRKTPMVMSEADKLMGFPLKRAIRITL